MLSNPHATWLQDRLDQDAERRDTKRLVLAIAQQLRLDLHHPALVLAPVLGQSLSLSNRRALEQWLTNQLSIQQIHAAEADVERLCTQLNKLLSAEEW